VTLTYGEYGGRYVPETLIPALDELEAAYAAAQRSPNTSAAQGIFDIRTYGAVGDGKAVDSPAINKAIEAARAREAARKARDLKRK